MLRLVKNDLRYHTFGRFFFAGAGVLGFIVLRLISGGPNVLYSEAFVYGLPYVCAVVMLSVGSEHSSGGFRNKAIAGYTKGRIFFAKIISSMICSSLLFMVMGVPLVFCMTTPHGPYFLFIYLMIYNFTAVVCACLVMLSGSTVKGIIAVILLFVFWTLITEPVCDALAEPAYEVGYTIDYSRLDEEGVDGSMIPKKIDNPSAVGGILRGGLKVVCAMNPYVSIRFTDDVMSMYDGSTLEYYDFTHPEEDKYGELEANPRYNLFREFRYFPLWSLAGIVITSGVGFIIIKRKELT